jgi:hypothetical protein
MIPTYMQGGTTPYQNPSYPMSRLAGSTYAAPLNYNQPSEVVGGYDARINPMTGEEIAQTNFAGGGGVSPAGMASLTQSRGRGDDSILVHMTPGEVHGLQSLAMAHGGSLTINPETGLYEAGFLKKLLPTLLGAGLSFIPGVGPLAAAGIVGAGQAARTGDLGKGLLAGIGAYGGAGLGSALSGVGTAAAGAATSEAIPAALTKEAVSAGAKQAVAQGVTGAGLSSGLNALRAAPLASLKALGSQLGATGVASLGGTAASLATPEYKPPEEEDPTFYISGGYTPEEGFRPGYYTNEYPGFPKMASGGSTSRESNSAAAYKAAAVADTKPKKLNPLQQMLQQIKEKDAAKQVRYTPGGYSTERGFAPGEFVKGPPEARFPVTPPIKTPTTPSGSTAGLGSYSASNEPYSGSGADQFAAYMQNLNKSFIPSPAPKPAPAQVAVPSAPPMASAYSMPAPYEDGDPFAAYGDTTTYEYSPYARGGGVSQNPVAGKLVTGHGDGMSDSIRANIDGHQEARLADGEFVVPADVVSHLGNGSTDAGSKKLYDMMDRVRKARTGRTRQAPQISPDKFMNT